MKKPIEEYRAEQSTMLDYQIGEYTIVYRDNAKLCEYIRTDEPDNKPHYSRNERVKEGIREVYVVCDRVSRSK